MVVWQCLAGDDGVCGGVGSCIIYSKKYPSIYRHEMREDLQIVSDGSVPYASGMTLDLTHCSFPFFPSCVQKHCSIIANKPILF